MLFKRASAARFEVVAMMIEVVLVVVIGIYICRDN